MNAIPAARLATRKDAEPAVHVLRRSIIELCVADHGNDAALLEKWLENKTVRDFCSWLEASGSCVVTDQTLESRVSV